MTARTRNPTKWNLWWLLGRSKRYHWAERENVVAHKESGRLTDILAADGMVDHNKDNAHGVLVVRDQT